MPMKTLVCLDCGQELFITDPEAPRYMRYAHIEWQHAEHCRELRPDDRAWPQPEEHYA